MTRQLLRLLFLPLIGAFVGDLVAKPVVAEIKVAAPTVDYQSFPVGKPPMHAKGLDHGEAGLCYTEIACKVGVQGEAPRVSLSDAKGTLLSVTFDIGVKITVWCQEGYTPTIMNHEETHRAISEHYYAMSYTVARRLADEAIARKLTLTGKPKADALNRALSELQGHLLNTFVQEIQQRTEFAQARFDAITDHSRNPIANADAMAQALRDEVANWNTHSEKFVK